MGLNVDVRSGGLRGSRQILLFLRDLIDDKERAERGGERSRSRGRGLAEGVEGQFSSEDARTGVGPSKDETVIGEDNEDSEHGLSEEKMLLFGVLPAEEGVEVDVEAEDDVEVLLDDVGMLIPNPCGCIWFKCAFSPDGTGAR